MAGAARNIPATAIIPKSCRERFLDLRGSAARPLADRKIVMAGVSDVRAPYEMGRPTSTYHVILHTVSGGGRFKGPRSAGKLTPGTVFIASADVAHYYASGPRWQVAWFHLADDVRWRSLRGRQPAVHRAPGTKELVAAMQGYISESIRTDGASVRAAEHYAEIIGIHLDRELGSTDDPASRRLMRDLDALWKMVHADLGRPWTVSELARHVHVSPVQLHRLALRFHGTTPMGFVTRLRMQRAEGLLLHTDYPLKLIAGLVGYETPFAFSRAFKRHAKKSPKAFRQE